MIPGRAEQGLYPIIRRARRPLVVQDDDSVPPSPPAVVAPMEELAPAGGAKRNGSARKANHGTDNATGAKQ